MEKMCFMNDESGHWYCIPIGLRGAFDIYLYDTDDDCVTFEGVFNKYKLNMHISNYSFENIKEIKD